MRVVSSREKKRTGKVKRRVLVLRGNFLSLRAS
jgi:hypothetical protein